MANAPGIEFHEKLSDLTECSICAENFINPKILPCVHTFCLHCLEEYGKHKRPGSRMGCPICRNEFTIPDKGLYELPNNFFVGKIVEIGKLATVASKEEPCEVCSEETMVAKTFCIDCEQKLCDRCINYHSRIKQCQNHQVVELGSQLKELSFRNSYCEHHPKEIIQMYCYQDNVAICLICCVESHQSHRCANVDKAAGQFTDQMKDDLRKVANRNAECEEAFQKLEKFKAEFAGEVFKIEENIRKSGSELKVFIDKQIEDLVQNLRAVRNRNLKSFESTIQDVGRFKAMIDSYQRYCNELLARGSPVDVCRAANQMHTRAIELGKLPANCSVDDFSCDEIDFHPENFEILMKQHRINNLVGELPVNKSSNRIVMFQKRIFENYAPTNWAKMTRDEEFKAIQLSVNDQEYKDVAKAVLSTAQTTVNEIVKIERIQNKKLYKQYVVCKMAMDEVNQFLQNEKTLWHGVSSDSLESIGRTGLSQSQCRKNGFYGTGVYFYKNFSYSALNACRSRYGSDLKHAYQCKVLAGEYVLGNGKMTTPPSKPGRIDLKYDSTVDNVAEPTIFVTYGSIQAYPEYLIHFK